MGGAQLPWAFAPQLSGHAGVGGPYSSYAPQQLHSLQAALQQLLQTQLVQQQQIQQLLQIVPLQLQQIQQLIQFVAQQTVQSTQLHAPQAFQPFGFPHAIGASGWLGSTPGAQPQVYGQGGFGGQGYVM